jgi:hypothetical protein
VHREQARLERVMELARSLVAPGGLARQGARANRLEQRIDFGVRVVRQRQRRRPEEGA